MRSFFATAIILATLASTISGTVASGTVPIQRVAGPQKANSYLVSLKKGASRTPIVQKLRANATVYDKSFLNSFAAQLTEAELDKIRTNDNVELIEEDGIVSIASTVTICAGAGVDVYVVNTGIYVEHSEFGGRARWGATFGPYAPYDGNGHGTHCAGIVGARQFGVAKLLTLIAVKVLSDSGSGSISDIIAGLNWVLAQVQANGRPSAVSIPLSAGGIVTLDNAVTALTDGGVHVVVAAGNSAADVSGFSPAHVPSAITVAASDNNNTFASFSNYGAGVDIIALGMNIVSVSIGTGSDVRSGTSAAASHIAGIATHMIAKDGNKSPGALSSYITSLAINGVISGVPSGTPNLFVNNGYR